MFRPSFNRPDALRGGVASIEFIMMLPVLVTFVAVAFWAARAGKAGLQAGQAAEESTYEISVQSHELDRLKQQSALDCIEQPELKQLVNAFVPQLKLDGGVNESQASRDGGEGVYGATRAVGEASDKDMFLSHPWESIVFAFPTHKSQQRPLTMPESMRGIAPDVVDLNEFTKLLEFDGMASAANMGNLQRSLNRSSSKTDDDLERVARDIDEAEDNLAELQRAQPVDYVKVNALRQEIDKLRKEQRDLQKAKRLLNNSQLPDPTISGQDD